VHSLNASAARGQQELKSTVDVDRATFEVAAVHERTGRPAGNQRAHESIDMLTGTDYSPGKRNLMTSQTTPGDLRVIKAVSKRRICPSTSEKQL
jgi:hypothetical protein